MAATQSPEAPTETYFTPRWWKALFADALSVCLAASAFVVYHNTCWDLPVSVTFFWFSLFAFGAILFFPRSFKRGTLLESIHPARMIQDWLRSFADAHQKGGTASVIASGVLYTLYFTVLLTALHAKQSTVVLTIMVLFLLQPPVETAASRWVLGDTCQWKWWVPGAFTIFVGVYIYRTSGVDLTKASMVFDTMFWLMALCIIFNISDNLARTHYRRAYGVAAGHAVMSIQAIAITLTFLWSLIEGGGDPSVFVNLTTEQFLALIYLGVLPTGIAITMTNYAQDVLGFPITASMSNLRAPAVLIIGLLPFAWFETNQDKLISQHYVGLVIACIGMVIIVAKAKSKPGHET